MPVTQTIEIVSNEAAGSGAVFGTGASTQVAYWTSPTTIAGNGAFTFNSTTLITSVRNFTANGYMNFKSSLFTAGVYGIFHLDEQMFYDADTSGAAVIFNLPLASSVETGRVYCFTDVTGNAAASPVTVNASGGDLINGAVNRQINTNYGSFWIRKNANGGWSAF